MTDAAPPPAEQAVAVLAGHHVGVHVADLDRSLHFYRDLLGFEVAFEWNPREPYVGTLLGYPDPDLHAAVLRIPGSDLFLELADLRNVPRSPVDATSAPPGTCHIGLRVADVDWAYRYLTDHGVTSISEPVTPTIGPNRGGRAVYMLDPDGNRIELIESPRRFDDGMTDATGVTPTPSRRRA